MNRIDPELIKACYKHYSTALKLLEEIDSEIAQFCKEHNLSLARWRDDDFEPLMRYEEDSRLMFLAFKNVEGRATPVLIVVDKDGYITVEEKK